MFAKLKTYLIGGSVVLLITLGAFLGRAFRKPDIVQETIYSRIEDTRHMKHLELVTYYFESMVDVTHQKKADKVYLLMIIPARIFNMNQRYVAASKKSYKTVVRNVQNSLIRAKQDVLNRAEVNGIRGEARRLGEKYFRSLFVGLGFEIQFVHIE